MIRIFLTRITLTQLFAVGISRFVRGMSTLPDYSMIASCFVYGAGGIMCPGAGGIMSPDAGCFVFGGSCPVGGACCFVSGGSYAGSSTCCFVPTACCFVATGGGLMVARSTAGAMRCTLRPKSPGFGKPAGPVASSIVGKVAFLRAANTSHPEKEAKQDKAEAEKKAKWDR